MTLSFKTKIGKDFTFFVQRIWLGLNFENCVYDEFYKNCILKTGNNWHIASSIKTPKIHTIRKDPKNQWQKMKNIHFVINNRTTKRFQFAPLLPVKSIQAIDIFSEQRKVYIGLNGTMNLLSDFGVSTLAKNDGFDSIEDFFSYFNKDFSGKIIHWTDLVYS